MTFLPQTPLARFAAILAGAALFCAPQAWAQEADDEDFSRMYGSIGIYNSDFDCEGVSGCTESLSTSLAYGYRFNERFGVEAGYITGPEVELHSGFNRLTLDVTTVYAAGTFRFGQGYAMVGMGAWTISATVLAGGFFAIGADSGTDPFVGAGYVFDVGKDKGVGITYRSVSGDRIDLSYVGVEYVHNF